MAARQWTLEQRKQQSELVRKWQPWKHSTGAKTPEGKVMSSRNAFKGGFSQKFRELRKILNKQKEFINSL